MTEAEPDNELDMTVAARLAAIVESSADAIVSKRLDGTIVSWNRAAERIFGYSALEIVGDSIFRLIPPTLHDEERDILRRVARGEQIAHYETSRIRKDGQTIVISLTVSPVLDSSGHIAGAASIKRDITDAKKNEVTQRQAAKLEAIGRLAGGLAHDFNNHLHALSGFAHFIGRDPKLSPSSRQDLLQIQKVTERMASLTHQLLAFARQQVLSLEVMDLSAVVADAQPMLQRLIGSNYDLRLEQAPGPRWVRVDRSQLVQVLMNLVINARDAMPIGGRVQVRSETLEVGPGQARDRTGSPVEAGAYAVLKVTDAGTGIAPVDIPRVFEPFYTTKEIGQGTGLGLATVEGIVSQCGGHILIDSRVGVGSTFTILLPLSRPPAGMEDAPAVAPQTGRWLGRILVVDDDDTVRDVITRLLQVEGYEVVTAATGREALDCFDQSGGAIDLVIADVVMPGMGGAELLHRLNLLDSSVPTILMSGHPRDVRWSQQANTQIFLQKPIMPDTLLEAARIAIRAPRS